ncbi:MAG TPA: phosphotransferase family protein [Acidimicrobiales bacterium]|nr:phosphotransferase family protein [Acidimicrobiales bacterium]
MGPTPEEVSDILSRALGGPVRNLRRLSGGASRITSSFELVAGDGTVSRLIVQQDRGDGAGQGGRAGTEAALLRAARAAGVPVPGVVASSDAAGLRAGWLVVEWLDGETIPRKILRDPEWAGARTALTAQCGMALAAIHSIDPHTIGGLPPRDPLGDPLPLLDGLGEVRPALELGVRWLDANRPPPGRWVTVHGDFRNGNLLVGPDGLRAVLDWELAHAGDPAEDIGWLCARAWRFGGPDPVGGFGKLPVLLEAYMADGGGAIGPERVAWWQVYATVKWAVICALQASAHLRGTTRSVELAAIGRRICESEWDLFVALGVVPPGPHTTPSAAGTPSATHASPTGAVAPASVVAPFGRPTAAELVEAVGEYLDGGRAGAGGDGPGARFEERVASNVLHTVARELELGPELSAAHARRLAGLGFENDRDLAAAIRSGDLGGAWHEVAVALAASARDQLLVANPSYLEGPGPSAEEDLGLGEEFG